MPLTYFIEISCPMSFAKFLAKTNMFCKMKKMIFKVFWMQADAILNTPAKKLMTIPKQVGHLHGS